jgi:hypothetical protein
MTRAVSLSATKTTTPRRRDAATLDPLDPLETRPAPCAIQEVSEKAQGHF